jgi:hypothetical protein
MKTYVKITGFGVNGCMLLCEKLPGLGGAVQLLPGENWPIDPFNMAKSGFRSGFRSGGEMGPMWLTRGESNPVMKVQINKTISNAVTRFITQFSLLALFVCALLDKVNGDAVIGCRVY